MTKKLWGGRFTKNTDPFVEKFTRSLHTDIALFEYDVTASIAHAKMLGKCKVIPKKDAQKIVKGLVSILNEFEKGKTKIDQSAEDVHTLAV